jgi:uncharacterized protein with FMN-binding domain
MPKSGGDGKISNGLVAASCAAVLAVYTAGYSRTREAARHFEVQAEERRSIARNVEMVPVTQPADVSTDLSASSSQPALEARASSARPVDTVPVASGVAEPVPQQIETTSDATPPVPAETALAEPPIAVTAASAPAPAPAPEPPPGPAPKWRDGTYTGWGRSRHGDIEARVVIKDGRIVESGISQCLTRYSCDVIDILIPQPVQLQSPDVSYVSRATQSSDAYYFGLVEALGKASQAQ